MSEDFVRGWVSFSALGGRRVSKEELQDALSTIPLDAALGVLARLGHELASVGPGFHDPRHSGGYLNFAIVDDFPCPLPRAPEMYAPGRVPFTGERHHFIHDLNLAWLSHQALLWCQDGRQTDELSYRGNTRVCRLLLIANDMLSPRLTPGTSLVNRRELAAELVRCSLFNRYHYHFLEATLEWEREREVWLTHLPTYFAEAENLSVCGSAAISLELYFDIVGALLSYLTPLLPENRWFTRASLVGRLEAHREEAELVLAGWIRTPTEYRERWRALVESGFEDLPESSRSLRLLREAPIIEARPGELIIPSLPLLVAKIADGAFYAVTDSMREDKQTQNRFHQALGRAYESYAHALVERIAKALPELHAIRSPRLDSDSQHELADSYLHGNEVAVAFEHKGLRYPAQFLEGASVERVLGPNDDVLRKLDEGESVSVTELKKSDDGLLTRPLWQHEVARPHLEGFRCTCDRVLRHAIPVFTYRVPISVHRWAREIYLDPLRTAAIRGSLNDPYSPQWVHVSELEALTAAAEQHGIDVIELMARKVKFSPTNAMGVFLFEEFGGIFVDRRLHAAAAESLQAIGRKFFPESASRQQGAEADEQGA